MLSDRLLQDITTHLPLGKITEITSIANSILLPDSTTKFSIRTSCGDFVLIISSKVSPLLVKRATDRQREARVHLRGQAAEPIELPVYEGFTDERSYAVWIKRTPISSNRAWSKIERMLIAPRIFRWLRAIASQ